jgi:ABC-type dipeptide/oligopeptide/nickel transport system permease component/ABC-type transport system substrate-binding protein
MGNASIRKFLLFYLAMALGFGLLLAGASWLMTPESDGGVAQYTPEQIAAVEALRDTTFDSDNPLVIQRDVDYAEGESAPWRPKGESPILAELVAEGKLPPVAERVGEEPCVLEGVDGIGNYGGVWHRLATQPSDIRSVRGNRMAYVALVRWSPQGYPIVPHVAKSYTVSEDNREFVFTLRKGIRWSDGEPFDADDILYWWEHECNDPTIMSLPPTIMVVRGQAGTVEKLGRYKVKFSFPEPNGLFLAQLATAAGRDMLNSPEHYLRQFHPTVGDPALIEKTLSERKVPSAQTLYKNDIKTIMNPDHPHLWPWVYRNYKANPPQTFVRNPYYWCVDPQGNQLPYIDRVVYDVKSGAMLGISAANGEVTMQARHIRYDQYTHLMSQREAYGFEIYHWYAGDRSYYVIHPNLNRRVDPDQPDSQQKFELLNDKRFRQALSLAINRDAVNQAEYNGQCEAAQAVPGPASFFYEPTLYKSFTDYDPDEAQRLLDEIGLTKRDYEGFRTFKDGSRMTFFLNFCAFTGEGPGQFVIDDWAAVGVRTIMRERSRPLYSTEMSALTNDFNVWIANGEFFPLIQPRHFVPTSGSHYARGFARWAVRGGLYGDPLADRAHGCIEPPPGHPLRTALEIYDRACAESDPARQRDIFREVLLIAAENVWTINICTSPPMLAIVDKNLRNVPRAAIYSWDFQSPGNCGVETFFFEEPQDASGVVEQIKDAILNPTPLPGVEAKTAAPEKSAAERFAALLRMLFILIGVALVALVGLKHPYIGRRLLIMIPTLIIISTLVFIVIQLPPGNFVETKILQLQESGDDADLQRIEDLKEMFHTEQGSLERYARWLGLFWFFSPKDENGNRQNVARGLLQGHMGISMESLRPVNEVVGDRILLTFLISLGTILFTWAVAIPIGIFSAVRQYSAADYVLTIIGFFGMCVPNFLLALLLMYFSAEFLGLPVSGLFSSQYGAQPDWDWPKALDLLKHIWVPIVVLGTGGTAAMIRVMRANLLDELKKPYVVTARAKGVRPMKLLFKYPVRLALNPFISGIGGLFPELVSGGAIVAMVLSLPTVGPLMLSALMTEDMYLAGSMLMVLSILGVLGTLVSDLLLLWLDPRIRFKGGTR